MIVSLRDGETLADYVYRITAELDEARAHARNHHLEACESCAVLESDRDAALALLREIRDDLLDYPWAVKYVAKIDALLGGTP